MSDSTSANPIGKRISCGDARSLLFVPANRPPLFEKAGRAGADALILDLEDSVPLHEKATARESIESAWVHLCSFEIPLIIRINPVDTEAGRADIVWLAHRPLPSAVMISKAQSAASLVQLCDPLAGVSLIPLIESAAGFDALRAIAAVPAVLRLAVGNIDFMADTGMQCDESEAELATLRFAVSIATRLNGLAPAVDGVTVQIGDDGRLAADTRRAMRFGFGGKLCIHPRQIGVVHDTFAPTEDELSWARRVLVADADAGGAAVQLDVRMVDAPVVLLARRTVLRADAAPRR